MKNSFNVTFKLGEVQLNFKLHLQSKTEKNISNQMKKKFMTIF